MSELNNSFFQRLAQKLPGMKKQIGEAIQKKRAARNGHLQKPICGVCGKEFSIKTAVVLSAPIPKYCPDCNTALEDGCAAFVTLDKPARFWIGKGVKPEFIGKVTVVSSAHMDSIEALQKELERLREQQQTASRLSLPPADA